MNRIVGLFFKFLTVFYSGCTTLPSYQQSGRVQISQLPRQHLPIFPWYGTRSPACTGLSVLPPVPSASRVRGCLGTGWTAGLGGGGGHRREKEGARTTPGTAKPCVLCPM